MKINQSVKFNPNNNYHQEQIDLIAIKLQNKQPITKTEKRLFKSMVDVITKEVLSECGLN